MRKRFGDDGVVLKRLISANLDREIESKKRYEEKMRRLEEERTSPQCILTNKIRDIMKEASAEEAKAQAILVSASRKMKEDMIAFFEAEIELVDGKRHTATMDQIEYLIENCHAAFDKFEMLAEQTKESRTSNFTDYEAMFNYLIEKVDVKFAFFAPAICLTRSKIKYDKLDRELKTAMFERIKDLGLAADEKFMENYGNVFKKQPEEKTFNV